MSCLINNAGDNITGCTKKNPDCFKVDNFVAVSGIGKCVVCQKFMNFVHKNACP